MEDRANSTTGLMEGFTNYSAAPGRESMLGLPSLSWPFLITAVSHTLPALAFLLISEFSRLLFYKCLNFSLLFFKCLKFSRLLFSKCLILSLLIFKCIRFSRLLFSKYFFPSCFPICNAALLRPANKERG